MKTLNKIITIFMIIIGIFFLLSASILPPLIDRNFYFIQIDALDIVNESGYTKEEIIIAFNDTLDFIWKGTEFNKNNIVTASESGISHFADCIPLFKLDLIVFIISTALLTIAILLHVFKIIHLERFNNFPFIFYSAILTLLLVVIVGVFGIIDFDSLFIVFHKVFFRGKSNWYFDPNEDSIILILPEKFFMNCGILIGTILLVLSSTSIIYGVIIKRKYIK